MRSCSWKLAFKQVGLFVLMLFATTSSITPTFAYIASQVLGSSDTAQGKVINGEWNYSNQFIASADALKTHALSLQANGNPYIDDVYNQTTTPSGATITLNSITLDGTQWTTGGTASGVGTTAPRLGFVQIIDRSLYPDSSTSVFPILPPAPSVVEPYPYYHFFIANDVKNTVTNNIYSLRFNYASTMTTVSTKYNVRTITLYARRGLYVAGQDIRDLRTNATLQVQYRTTSSSTWTRIGSTITPAYSTATSAAFTQYTFSVPSTRWNQNLYFRIVVNAGTSGTGSNAKYSRIVVDNLTLA